MNREEIKNEIERLTAVLERYTELEDMYYATVDYTKYVGFMRQTQERIDELTEELYKNHHKLLEGLGE